MGREAKKFRTNKSNHVSEINTLSAEYERLCNEESDKVRDKLLRAEMHCEN